MSLWTRERSNLCSHGGSFLQLPVEESAVKCWPIECHLQSPWITDGPWPLRCPHTIPNPPGQARLRSGCWSASCSETERWARPAWWSATQRTATQLNMFPLRSTTSQVSRGQILILHSLIPLIFIDQGFSQTLLRLQRLYDGITAQIHCKWVCRLWSLWSNWCELINLPNVHWTPLQLCMFVKQPPRPLVLLLWWVRLCFLFICVPSALMHTSYPPWSFHLAQFHFPNCLACPSKLRVLENRCRRTKSQKKGELFLNWSEKKMHLWPVDQVPC